MKFVGDYKLLTNADRKSLEDVVNELAKTGWTLISFNVALGNAGALYCAAMGSTKILGLYRDEDNG